MPKIVSLDPALVAAAGIVPNAASNLEDIERALQEAPALRKRLGITSLDKLKRIGEGSWARVYRLGDGRVLKLTTDASDANAAALVAGAPSRPAGLAPVHEVVKFPWPVRDRKWDPIRGRSGDVKRDLYAIVMTYVPKAKEDSPEEELLDQIFRAFDNLLVDAGFNGTNPLWELRRREEDDLTPWLWDLTHGWMWLAERGWIVRDVSTHNIGILNGEVVLLDMGLSSTDGAMAPEIDMAANPGRRYAESRTASSPAYGDTHEITHPKQIGSATVWVGTALQIAARIREKFGDHDPLAEAIDGLGGEQVAYLDWIQIRHRSQRHGAGRKLLQETLDWIDERGAVATYAYSAPDGDQDPHRLLRFYLREGFEVVPDSDTAGDTFAIVRQTPRVELRRNGSMSSVVRVFDECFATLKQQFPDFGDIELHEDEKAGGDNGHGSERQFGYCKDGDPIVLAFAAKTDSLARPFIRGLMRHEFGHAIDFRYGKAKLERTLGIKLPAGVERRADAIAEAVFGDPIVYGGKHLVQCVSCEGEYPRPKKLGA